MAGDIAEELARLRTELSQHSTALLTLAAQRLDAIVTLAGNRAGGTSKEAVAVPGFQAEYPQTLVVVCTRGSAPWTGRFDLVSGRRVHGYPLWLNSDREAAVYSTALGCWALGHVTEAGEPSPGPAHMLCSEPHLGAGPEVRGDWYSVAGDGITISVSAGGPVNAGTQAADDGDSDQDPPSPLPVLPAASKAPAAPLVTRFRSTVGSIGGAGWSRARQSQISEDASRDDGAPKNWLDADIQKQRSDTLVHFDSSGERSARLRTIESKVQEAVNGRMSIVGQKDQAPKAVFANADEMKEKLRKNILNQQYNVENFYKPTGFCQAVARNYIFEYVTLFIIVCNGVWIGYEVDMNKAEALPVAPVGFQLMENFFCFFFTFEVTTRFGAFRKKIDALKDLQFVFDAALVALMIIETWVIYVVAWLTGGSGAFFEGTGALSLLRMLRLTRICRIVRILRAVPELMVLLKGVSVASRAVFWILGLLLIIVYVFAVAFRIVSKDTALGEKYFSSIWNGMATLTLDGLLPDNGPTVYDIGDSHILFAGTFMVFIVIGSITLMSMLIGVLCESVSAVAAFEKENLKVHYVKSELETLLDSLNRKMDEWYTRDDIESIIQSQQAVSVFVRVGVDVAGLIDIAVFQLFRDGNDRVKFSDVLDLVLQLRGSNIATVRDVVNLRKFISEELLRHEEHLGSILNAAAAADAEAVGKGFASVSTTVLSSLSRLGTMASASTRQTIFETMSESATQAHPFAVEPGEPLSVVPSKPQASGAEPPHAKTSMMSLR